MCCTGAHLLPKMGKLNTLPTTASAQNIPARASFFTERFFMKMPPLQNTAKQKQETPVTVSPVKIHIFKVCTSTL